MEPIYSSTRRPCSTPGTCGHYSPRCADCPVDSWVDECGPGYAARPDATPWPLAALQAEPYRLLHQLPREDHRRLAARLGGREPWRVRVEALTPAGRLPVELVVGLRRVRVHRVADVSPDGRRRAMMGE